MMRQPLRGLNTLFVRDCLRLPKYHPRKWVDCSGAAYKTAAHPLCFCYLPLPLAARGGEKESQTESRVRSSVGRLEQSTHFRGWYSAPFSRAL